MYNHNPEASVLDNQEDFLSPYSRFRRRRPHRVLFRREDGSEMELDTPFLFPELAGAAEEVFEPEAPAATASLPAIPDSVVRQWGSRQQMGAHIEQLTYAALPELAGKAPGNMTKAEKRQFTSTWERIRKKMLDARAALFTSGFKPPLSGREDVPFGFVKTTYRPKNGDPITGVGSSSKLLSAERADKAIARLHATRRFALTQDELDTIQRMANVESGGRVQVLNSYDGGLVSFGFLQLTLHVGKLQALIQMAPNAFARYGIQLDPVKKYFSQKHPAILGVDDKERWQLRWNGWAERFYYAGFDPDIIEAQVKYAVQYLRKQLADLKSWLKKQQTDTQHTVYNKFVNSYYNRNAYIRGLFQESFNNNPTRATSAVAAAVRNHTDSDPVAWLEKYKAVLIKKGWQRLVDETAKGATVTLGAPRPAPELEGDDEWLQELYGEPEAEVYEYEDEAPDDAFAGFEDAGMNEEAEHDAYTHVENEYASAETENGHGPGEPDNEYEFENGYEAAFEEGTDEFDGGEAPELEEGDEEFDDGEAPELEEGDGEFDDGKAPELEEGDGEFDDGKAPELGREFEDGDETFDEGETLEFEEAGDDASGHETAYLLAETGEDEEDAYGNETGMAGELEATATAGTTAYLNASAVRGHKRKTGAYLPTSFKPSASVNVLVYLHGLYQRGDETNGMAAYWKSYAPIRELFEGSGKNAILLAPALGSNPQSSLVTFHGNHAFDKFIQSCFDALKTKGLLPQHAAPGRIIIAAHSAGGKPMSGILNAVNKLAANIDECWGFDCLYGYPFDRWLQKDRQRNRLYHYWAHNGAGKKSRPGVNGDTLQGRHANMQNIAPKARTDHQHIIPYAWREEIDKRPWFGTAAAAPARLQQQEAPAAPALKLVPLPLTRDAITVVKANRAKQMAEIKEAPAVYLKAIVKGAGEDPDKWFNSFTRVTFLGRQLKSQQYVHISLAKLLQKTEAAFMAKYPGKSATAIGDALGLSQEGMAASRGTSSTATYSYHMFGLALDINYNGNPYIQPGAHASFNQFMKKVGLLNTGSAIKTVDWDAWKSLSLKPADYMRMYDEFAVLDRHLERYFGYLANPDALQARLSAADAGYWYGKTPAQATAVIKKDLRDITGAWKGTRRNAEAIFRKGGFLSLSRDFVKGMVEAGFDWGGRYGDMMHFDMRTTGVGAKIEAAKNAYISKKNREAKAKYLTPA